MFYEALKVVGATLTLGQTYRFNKWWQCPTIGVFVFRHKRFRAAVHLYLGCFFSPTLNSVDSKALVTYLFCLRGSELIFYLVWLFFWFDSLPVYYNNSSALGCDCCVHIPPNKQSKGETHPFIQHSVYVACVWHWHCQTASPQNQKPLALD